MRARPHAWPARARGSADTERAMRLGLGLGGFLTRTRTLLYANGNVWLKKLSCWLNYEPPAAARQQKREMRGELRTILDARGEPGGCSMCVPDTAGEEGGCPGSTEKARLTSHRLG